MIQPNLYTLSEASGTYGLHKFKDNEIVLVKQHSCGDWQTMRPPTAGEVLHFEKHGRQVVQEVRKGVDK